MALEGCAVRSWRASDAEALARNADNRNIWLNLRDGFPHPFTPAHAEAFIAVALAQRPECRFAIEVEGEAVGSIGFSLHTDVDRVSAELGYWLAEPYWGKGIMARAVRAVTEYAVGQHGLTRVFAVPYEWNPASFRVLEKAGYALEGRMRRSVIKDGQVLDQYLYAFVVPEAAVDEAPAPR